jgi:pimeloyl-ACP methyl ester carboxylesterase
LLAHYLALPQQLSAITHHFLTNGNIYLPLANLTDFQKALRNPQTSQAVAASVTAPLLAQGLGQTCFTPPLAPDDPQIRAMSESLASGSGLAVLPATIKYLDERAQAEIGWLESLQASPIPTTLIWGIHDMISPIRVADYVWNTFLRSRTAPSAYWILPCANHYLQHDQPAALAHIIRLSLSEQTPTAPMNLASDPCAPVLVGREGPSHRGSTA